MVKAPCPVTVCLEPKKSSLVEGCPGVPRSVPRINTKLLVRSINGEPFTLRSVGVELRTVQRVSIPSTLGSSDSCHEYKIYDNPGLFNPSFGNFSESILGLDLPILIMLPRDILPSGYNVNWNASTVHYLVVKVSVGDSSANEINFAELFPIGIKVYDSLPIYRQFTESVNDSQVSNDQQIIIDYNLHQTCSGPDDPINIDVKIMKNSLNYNVNKRLKLKSVSLKVKEILECHEGGLPAFKDTKIYESYKECKDMVFGTDGLTFNYDFKLPLNNDFLSNFISKPHIEAEKYKFMDDNSLTPNRINTSTSIRQSQMSLIEGIPITHYQCFTTSGKLFSIRYEIVIKVKLNHGKDFNVGVPLVLCPYNKQSSEYLLNWIVGECRQANDIFGKDVINQLITTFNIKDANNIVSRFKPPIRVYKYNKTDWLRLGFGIDSLGSANSAIRYID